MNSLQEPKTLKELILCVEDNCNINDGKWADWQCVSDIYKFYSELDTEDDYISQEYADSLLQRAIDTNGRSLAKDAREYYDILYDNDIDVEPWVRILEEKYSKENPYAEDNN